MSLIPAPRARRAVAGAIRILPGLGLSVGVAAAAHLVAAAEAAAFGEVWLEPLVLAILGGTLVRSLWTPSARWLPGVAFSAKLPLEIAIVLLGAAVSARALLAAGPILLLGIVATVLLAILVGFAIGRLLGLPKRLAVLVACGNAICGNSAIAATAPVIGANGDDVAASIAFTAVLGVAVVLGLPLIGALLQLSDLRYGVLAGLTVYAVPQVVAAAAPMGSAAVQIGTLVKLVRVLTLGPVCMLLALLAPIWRDAAEAAPAQEPGPRRKRPPLRQLAPWFVLGFLALAGARLAGLLPEAALGPASVASSALTVIAMAALGLGVDIRAVAQAGGRVTAAAALSLLLLGGLSLALIFMTDVAAP